MTQNNRQPPLFAEPATTVDAPVGQQGDIVYLDRPARSVLNPPESTGMPYWSLNPYVGCAFGCAYCYARYAHRYVREREDDSRARDGTSEAVPGDGGGAEGIAVSPPLETTMPPWLAFERRIYVKRGAAELLAAQLRRARLGRSPRTGRLLRGEALVIGTATDPYQPAERHFRVTRQVLETLAEYAGLRIVLITKSALVTRDIDLLIRIASRSRFTLHLSLITLDRDLARRIEPRAPTPEARVRAVRRLRDAGIDVGINMMPVLPGITDRPADLAALIARVADAGATHVNAGPLRPQAEARRRYLPFIESEFPHLAARYRATYTGHHHIGDRYRSGLTAVVRKLCDRSGIAYGGFDDDRRADARAPTMVSRDEQLEAAL
jgi:DNA repair photolyase